LPNADERWKDVELMADTEQIIYINGYAWVRVPDNSTQAVPVYSERQVRAAGGNPAIVQGLVVWGEITSSDTCSP
jgi:hypothetical protein